MFSIYEPKIQLKLAGLFSLLIFGAQMALGYFSVHVAWLTYTLLVILGAISLYTWRFLKSIEHQTPFWTTVRLAILLTGLCVLFFFLPGPTTRLFFALAIFPLHYFFMRTISGGGEELLLNQILVSSFSAFLAITGLWFYLPQSNVLPIFSVALISGLLAYAGLANASTTKQVKLIGSLIIAILSGQIFWALAFLPLHYSVLGFALASLFNAFWTIYYYDVYHLLTARKVQFQLTLAAVAIILVSLLSPWSIIG